MKKIIVPLATVLSVILVIIGIVAVGFASNFNQKVVTIGDFSKEHLPKYRLMIIVDGSNKQYVESLKKGLDKGATEKEVAFELWALDGERKDDEILKQFDIAIQSKVDGIIIQTFKDERFNQLFINAHRNNIPVLTIETDIPEKEKVSHITYNWYQIGTNIGKLLEIELRKQEKMSGTVIMFYNAELNKNEEALGIQEKLEAQYEVKLEKVDYTGKKMLNAEGLTREIIDEYENIAAIICTNEDETLGVVQALKSAGKINDVTVIGFGYSEEIIDFIDREIIFATIISDNERLGYEAMINLVDYKSGGFVSNYKDISVKIINKANIATFKKQLNYGETNR